MAKYNDNDGYEMDPTDQDLSTEPRSNNAENMGISEGSETGSSTSGYLYADSNTDPKDGITN